MLPGPFWELKSVHFITGQFAISQERAPGPDAPRSPWRGFPEVLTRLPVAWAPRPGNSPSRTPFGGRAGCGGGSPGRGRPLPAGGLWQRMKSAGAPEVLESAPLAGQSKGRRERLLPGPSGSSAPCSPPSPPDPWISGVPGSPPWVGPPPPSGGPPVALPCLPEPPEPPPLGRVTEAPGCLSRASEGPPATPSGTSSNRKLPAGEAPAQGFGGPQGILLLSRSRGPAAPCAWGSPPHPQPRQPHRPALAWHPRWILPPRLLSVWPEPSSGLLPRRRRGFLAPTSSRPREGVLLGGGRESRGAPAWAFIVTPPESWGGSMAFRPSPCPAGLGPAQSGCPRALSSHLLAMVP